LTAAFYRAEEPTASQRKKLNAAIANVGEPPKVATGGARGQAMPDGDSTSRDAVASSRMTRIYHGTSKEASEAIAKAGFDVSSAADGSIWFTTDKSAITSGNVAATGKGAIVERLLDEKKLKLGGWNETDRFSTDQLIAQGYDGMRLEDGGEVTFQIFFQKSSSIQKKRSRAGRRCRMRVKTCPKIGLRITLRRDIIKMMEQDKIQPIFTSSEGVELGRKMTEEQRKKSWARRAIETGYYLPSGEMPEEFRPKNLLTKS